MSENNESHIDQFDWAKLVLERDNYTCVKCGNKDNLIAYYIGGSFVISTDIGLGITLCTECYNTIYSEEGFRFIDRIRVRRMSNS